MARLEKIIKLLDAADRSSRSNPDGLEPRCLCASNRLGEIKDEYANRVGNELGKTMLGAWEVRNAPSLATHLSTVVKTQIKKSNDSFVKISGFRLNEGKCELEQALPDLSPLGNAEDWRSMQIAGYGVVAARTGKFAKTSDKPRTRGQNASGWRNYYIKFLRQDEAQGNDYPRILKARLTWGAGKNLAPYWYWYDQTINTDRAYPRQQTQGLSNAVADVTEAFLPGINSACAAEGYNDKDPIIEIELKLLEEAVERSVDAFAEGREVSEIDVKISFGGRYKGRVVSEDEVLRLLNSGEIVLSSSFDRYGKVKLNLQVATNRQFTGLYARLTRR